MMLSESAIYGWVQAWVSKNKENIVRSYCRDQGWENWAELALAEYLQSLPGAPRINREQPVDAGGDQGLNLKLTCHDGSAFSVELKCESRFASANLARARRGDLSYPRFEADIHRLRWRRAASGRAMAIMIAVTEEAQNSIQSLVAAYSIDRKTFNATDDWLVAVYKY